MLYREFIEGVGCKENEHNYQIYKRLELMYMADDSISKQEIYEYGKKLVDNSKSDAEIWIEENIKAEIAEYKSYVADYKRCLEQEKVYIEPNKSYMKHCRENIKYYQRKIKECKWILEA